MTIVVMVGLVGRQNKPNHAERVKLQKEQERLNQVSEDILRRCNEARGEIIAIMDENAPTGKSDADARLAEMVDHLLASTNNSFAPDSLKQLDSLTDKLEVVERQATEWRANHNIIVQDLRGQR